MGLPKWSELPVPVRWYIGLLLCLGLIPIGFSLFYPLDKLNAVLDAKITATPVVLPETTAKLETVATKAEVPTIPKSVTEAIAAAPAPAPVNKTTEKTDWVGIIGGINSAVIAWFMYFDRRRRSKREGEEYDNPDKPERPGQITPKSDNDCNDDTSG